jgi:arginine decarboxylase
MPNRTSEVPPLAFVPSRVFFTQGVGTGKTHRIAMQQATQQAGVSDCNLVKTSSVIPPGCRILTRQQGARLLRPGAVVYSVIATGFTNEANQIVSAALCWAQPEDPGKQGTMTEVEDEETLGKTAKAAADEAGEALITIVAQQAGAKVDPKATWEGLGRNRHLKLGRMRLRIGSLAPSAVGPEGEERFAVVLALAVFL